MNPPWAIGQPMPQFLLKGELAHIDAMLDMKTVYILPYYTNRQPKRGPEHRQMHVHFQNTDGQNLVLATFSLS